MGIMISILALSCLIVLPAVLANDPPCTRCCNLESTVVVSALRLVQCEKGALDCPEDQNLVDDYLPEYMRCLIKNNKRASGRDGRSMQFLSVYCLIILLPSLVVGLGVTTVTMIATRLTMIATRLTMIAMRLRMKVMALKRRMRTKRRMKTKRKRRRKKRRKRSKMRSKKLLSITVLL